MSQRNAKPELSPQQIHEMNLLTLQKYSITCKQIANTLEDLQQEYLSKALNKPPPELQNYVYGASMPLPYNISNNIEFSQGDPFSATRQRYVVGGYFILEVSNTGQFQECPFNDGWIGNTEYTLLNTRLNQYLRFSDLTIHLIKEHCFFGYNVNVFDIMRILELEPLILQLTFNELVQKLNNGDIIKFDFLPQYQYKPYKLGNYIGSFYGRDGYIYLVEVQYNQATNQIFPPV
jgi:hypothetical protein